MGFTGAMAPKKPTCRRICVRNINPIYEYMLAFYYFFLIESFPMPNQYFTIISLKFLSRNSTSKTIPEYLIAKVPFLCLKL